MKYAIMSSTCLICATALAIARPEPSIVLQLVFVAFAIALGAVSLKTE